MPTQPSVSITVSEAIQTVNQSRPNYFEGIDDETQRGRQLLDMLKRKGNTTFNNGGSPVNIWTSDVDEPPISPWGSFQGANYTQRPYSVQYTMPWGGYKGTDLWDKHQQVILSGSQAARLQIYSYYDRVFKKLKQAFMNALHGEFFINGMSTGNDKRFWGINTVFGTASTTVAADKIAKLSNTYANQPVALGGLGSTTWTSSLSTKPNASVGYDWPEGQGAAKFDAGSPLWMNTTSTSYGVGSNQFKDTCEKQMRQAFDWMNALSGPKGGVEYCMMARNLFTQFKDYMSAKFTALLPHKPSMDWGFTGTVDFEGVPIRPEWDCPVNEYYFFNLDSIELAFCGSEMTEQEGPKFDMNALAFLFLLLSAGNYRFRHLKGLGKGSAVA